MDYLPDNRTDFLFYTSAAGEVKAEVFLKDESVWLTQKSMATLFGVKVPAINKHLKNVFDSKELDEDSVVSILETTAADNKKYKTRFYNLDAIVSVGYRVNSYQATQFRSKYFCKMRGPDPETLPRWEMAAQVASQVVAHACAKAAWASWQVAAGFKCWSMGKRGLVGIKEAVAGNTDRE